jgi:hypothetical protein
MKNVSKIFIVVDFGSPIKDLKLCLNQERNSYRPISIMY